MRALAAVVGLLVLGPAHAAVSVYMTPETLAERAPIVVEALVLRSAAGLDPRTGGLATYVTLQVEQAHRGVETGERLILREPGGSYGERTLELDAVPVYRPGERVLAFLEPARDGALRTVGMFFGKFTIDDGGGAHTRWAVRDLEGRGTILRGPDSNHERLPLRDLVALTATSRTPAPQASVSRGGGAAADPRGRRVSRDGRAWLAVPAEFSELRWGGDSPKTASADSASSSGTDRTLSPGSPAGAPDSPQPEPAFAPAASERSRWREVDTGGVVVVHVDPTGNPLGNAAAAVSEIQRAMSAWNGVPEARVQIVSGNTSLAYRATHSKSPTAVDTRTNVILFDDPYDEISDPSQCSGVLAIGGYWRTGSVNSWVHGIGFYGITQSHVIFNNDFECVLGHADDLAEVATHELGHALGFGHSTAPNAIMRSTVWRFRGPVLGDDDRDAAHCFYPHVLRLTRPNGGETWSAGSIESIQWTTTAESGVDPGTVDLEYSIDGGASWIAVSRGEPNDGSHSWAVPSAPSAQVRLRVIRPNRAGAQPTGFPGACSSDATDAPFAIHVEPVFAGSVAQASPADGGLGVIKNADGTLELHWGPSCSSTASDFAVYEGSLTELRQGRWDHAPIACSTGGSAGRLLFAGPGDRYFLVASIAGEQEGPLGQSSYGAPRPAAAEACAPREPPADCGD